MSRQLFRVRLLTKSGRIHTVSAVSGGGTASRAASERFTRARSRATSSGFFSFSTSLSPSFLSTHSRSLRAPRSLPSSSPRSSSRSSASGSQRTFHSGLRRSPPPSFTRRPERSSPWDLCTTSTARVLSCMLRFSSGVPSLWGSSSVVGRRAGPPRPSFCSSSRLLWRS